MGKYLVIWEMDNSHVPVDPKERATAWGALLAMVKKDMQDGVMVDWGGFVGESTGYCVCEGSELEVEKRLQQYVPYALFEVHPISSLKDKEELMKVMLK